MQSDLPHTQYFGKGGRNGGGVKENDPAITKQMEAIRRAEKRRASNTSGDAPEYTMNEIFN